MNGPETRESLLVSLNGPTDARWHEFTALYRPLIFRVALARGMQHADADDLTQEVLLIVRRSLDSYDASKASFRSWLYQITRNLVVNHFTRGQEPAGSGDSRVARLLSQQPDLQDETASLFRLEYRRACFQHAAAQVEHEFQPATWQAFWLTAVEQQSIARTAAQLGRSPGAIRVARSRVLGRLRHVVAEYTGHTDPPC